MLETLLGQIKGVLGKSFIIAGLLPSAVFLFGWRWFRSGSTTLAESIRQSFSKPAETAPDAVLTGLTLLALALLFYAGRGPILSLFQSLPGRHLAFLSRRGKQRQRRLRLIASNDPAELPLKRTAFLWSRKNFIRFTRDTPAMVEPSSASEAAVESRKARDILSRRIRNVSSRASIVFSEQEEQQLISGLFQLYLCATPVNRPGSPPPDDPASPPVDDPGPPPGQPDELTTEIEEWRKLLHSPFATAALRMVEVNLTDRWARSYQQFQVSFPQNEVWMQPTTLGNRIAALDDYAETRYGITTSTLWSRLWGVLPKDGRAEITDARLAMEVMTNFSIGLVGFGLLALATCGWETWLTLRRYCQFAAAVCVEMPVQVSCPAAVVFNQRAALVIPLAFGLSVLFYHGAIYAFGTLAEKMIRLVDLHRLQLISALGYKSPQTVGEELEILKELNEFFTQPNNQRELKRRLVQPEKPKPEGGGKSVEVEDA